MRKQNQILSETEQKIRNIFYDVTEFRERDNKIYFTTKSEVNYVKLIELSKAFNTTQIEFEPETRGGGGCPTCDYSYGVFCITITL